MILILKTNKDKLHDYEFVAPIEKILKEKNLKFLSVHYTKINKDYIKKAEKIIISGCSLNEFDYLEDINKFAWIKNFDKPLLGICSGMQIIGMVYDGEIISSDEIGLFEIDFMKSFLGLNGKDKVYMLHKKKIILNKNVLDNSKSDLGNFNFFKIKSRPFYGVLFHPEVRNEIIIRKFCEID